MKKEAPEAPTYDTPQKKEKEYLEVRIPKLTFRNTPINVYLVCALVIFAFLLGMLTNKVLYLEKVVKTNDTTTNTATANVNNQAGQAQPTPPQIVDVEVGKLPIKGDENAKVTIVEFSDFQCPFCKSFIDDTYAKLDEEYIQTGKVKFAYRHYPLTVIHPNAPKAAEASECANEQGKFWEYHDKLFDNQDVWSPLAGVEVTNSFVEQANQLGMDTDQFRSCVESAKYKQQVDDDLAAGQVAQVDGTPAFFINGYRIVGAVPYDQLKARIEEELKK